MAAEPEEKLDLDELETESLDELEPLTAPTAWEPPTEKPGEVAKRVVTDAEAG